MSIEVKYTTAATATGGRDGHTRTNDGCIDLALATPKELGGPGGDGTNPEQLFAAGYSACFLSAVKYSAAQLKVHIPAETAVTATVGIGPKTEGGYGFEVDLGVSLPGLDAVSAQQVVKLAHQTCPYSNATRNNVEVAVHVV